MKKYILFSAITIALLLCSNLSFGQTPNGTLNLGILTSFEAFTGAGAVANGAGATVNGDVGTNIGIISGFVAPYAGNTYNANAVTAQCRFDLFRTYIHLNALFVDYPGTHAPAFGGGETITPGVYYSGGAGSIGGALTLDGGGDPDAFFVIKFYGAMTVGAGAVVNLTNGTQSCNVFYIADGAISVAADANIKGTLFAKVGAVGLGANVILEGRMLTMAGAITTGVGAVASPPPGVSTIPIFCETGCSPAPEVDVLGVVSNFALYTSLGATANTGISGIDGNIGTNGGAISGYEDSIVIGSPHNANATTAQAKIDLDNAYTALMALPNTILSHAPAFGTGETITAGVYFINGAGSLSGTMTLDAQNNPDAIFVFKFAGAFSVAAASKIILANGARRCNVFWIGGAGVATGAVTIGAGSDLKGTFLSHGGACNTGAGVFLSGRQLSTGGAVNTYSGIIYNNPVCVTSTSLGSSVALVKTASVGGTGALGDVITYTFTVTNTGSTALTNVVVTDPMVGLIITGSPIASLAAGASSSVITGTYTITQTDIDAGSVTNSATATSDEGATDISGTANDNDTPTITTITQTPAVALVKTANVGGTGTLGDVITYTFTITNTGNITLTNIVVTDPMVGLIITGSPIASMAAGASSSVITGTYTITQADIDAGSVTNSATATSDEGATDISGTANDNDTSTITTITQTPAVALVKTASVGGTGSLGDVITYIFAVTNTGNATLTNVVVTDPMVGLIITGSPIASLAAGASSSVITGTYTITQTDIDAGSVTNSATATSDEGATDISGTANDNDTPTITTITQTPAVALVKTASVGGTGTLGDVITYTFTITNTGNATLTNVVVTDPMVGLIITGSPIASLAAGASSSVITGTYTITQADIDAGSVTNSATATSDEGATDISGTANDNDTPTTTTITQTPAVALVKTASVGGAGSLGDVITYIFAVTNTGNATLTNVVVTDPMVGLTITGSPIASMAAGASSSVITGTYTITQADIDAGSVTNSATATSDEGATDISGTANDNDTPTITTITQTPAVALVKTASVGGMGTLGDVITYIFAVTNTGNATLTNVVVTDPMVGLIITGSPIASLAPGTIAIAVGTYTITQTDIDAGSVTNSATVTSDEGATDTSGTANDNDTPTVTATPTPIPALPDFTPATDIDALVFLSSAPTKDFVVNISEIGGAPSDGQVVLKIPKLSAFTITYGAATSTSNVNGGVSVNNNDWVITEDSLFITMTLKAGVIIGANTFSAIGFSITLNSNVPTQTSQPITVTIVNGSGLDSQNNNNTINTVVKAQ